MPYAWVFVLIARLLLTLTFAVFSIRRHFAPNELGQRDFMYTDGIGCLIRKKFYATHVLITLARSSNLSLIIHDPFAHESNDAVKLLS
jgi:hypothetical protein